MASHPVKAHPELHVDCMDGAGAAPGVHTPCLLQGTGSSSVLTSALQELQGHCSVVWHVPSKGPPATHQPDTNPAGPSLLCFAPHHLHQRRRNLVPVPLCVTTQTYATTKSSRPPGSLYPQGCCHHGESEKPAQSSAAGGKGCAG